MKPAPHILLSSYLVKRAADPQIDPRILAALVGGGGGALAGGGIQALRKLFQSKRDEEENGSPSILNGMMLGGLGGAGLGAGLQHMGMQDAAQLKQQGGKRYTPADIAKGQEAALNAGNISDTRRAQAKFKMQTDAAQAKTDMADFEKQIKARLLEQEAAAKTDAAQTQAQIASAPARNPFDVAAAKTLPTLRDAQAPANPQVNAGLAGLTGIPGAATPGMPPALTRSGLPLQAPAIPAGALTLQNGAAPQEQMLSQLLKGELAPGIKKPGLQQQITEGANAVKDWGAGKLNAIPNAHEALRASENAELETQAMLRKQQEAAVRSIFR